MSFLFLFFVKLLHLSHVQSMVFLTSFCRTTFCCFKSSSSMRTLFSIHYYKEGLIFYSSSALFIVSNNIFVFLNTLLSSEFTAWIVSLFANNQKFCLLTTFFLLTSLSYQRVAIIHQKEAFTNFACMCLCKSSTFKTPFQSLYFYISFSRTVIHK